MYFIILKIKKVFLLHILEIDTSDVSNEMSNDFGIEGKGFGVWVEGSTSFLFLFFRQQAFF